MLVLNTKKLFRSYVAMYQPKPLLDFGSPLAEESFRFRSLSPESQTYTVQRHRHVGAVESEILRRSSLIECMSYEDCLDNSEQLRHLLQPSNGAFSLAIDDESMIGDVLLYLFREKISPQVLHITLDEYVGQRVGKISRQAFDDIMRELGMVQIARSQGRANDMLLVEKRFYDTHEAGIHLLGRLSWLWPLAARRVARWFGKSQDAE